MWYINIGDRVTDSVKCEEYFCWRGKLFALPLCVLIIKSEAVRNFQKRSVNFQIRSGTSFLYIDVPPIVWYDITILNKTGVEIMTSTERRIIELIHSSKKPEETLARIIDFLLEEESQTTCVPKPYASQAVACEED